MMRWFESLSTFSSSNKGWMVRLSMEMIFLVEMVEEFIAGS